MISRLGDTDNAACVCVCVSNGVLILDCYFSLLKLNTQLLHHLSLHNHLAVRWVLDNYSNDLISNADEK